jgi:Antitoxin SocA-like, Panacea domain
MAGGREFDRAKFKELVLYLIQASVKDEGFGMVKLNKLLFRADFEAYRQLGASITGETYEKQDYGPVARNLPLVLDELSQGQRLVGWLRIPAGPFERKVPQASDEKEAQPDMTLFPDAERRIVGIALEELAPHGGRSVSRWSHQESAGWRVVGIGVTIPYETAIVASKVPSDEAVEQLRQRVLSGNWD